MKFDVIYNLDKDREACAVAATTKAIAKKGFTLNDGIVSPCDRDAAHKYMTGIFDDLSRQNTKSYLEEIFEMCGMKFEGEKYILDSFEEYDGRWKFPKNKKILGLNTGCGGRWTTRLWPDEHWTTLARKLKKAGYSCVLLGGEQEHKKNGRISKASGALYFGHFPFRQFIN